MRTLRLLTVWTCAYCLALAAGAPQEPQVRHFVHSGKKLASSTPYFGTREGLAGHKYLKVECSFRLKNNPSGFNFVPYIRIFDHSGKVILSRTFGDCELLPRPDDPQIIDGQSYVKIPPKGEKAALVIIFTGNRGEIDLVRCALSPSETPEIMPKAHFPRFNDPPVLNEEQLDAMLEKMSPVRAEIRRCGEYNGLFINGREIVPSIYNGSFYKDRNNARHNMVHAFQKNGMNLFSVTFSLGACQPYHNGDVWLGPGKYDVTPITRNIRAILKQAPDAKILLNFSVNQYRGYAQTHPQELCMDNKGRYNVSFNGDIRSWSREIAEPAAGKEGRISAVSDYSRSFHREAAKAIEDVCALVAASPEGKAVAMVYLNGGCDGQWLQQWDNTDQLADYSPACLAAYREFLREKYHDSEAELRKAWSDPNASFDSARVPAEAEWWNTKKAFHTLYRENSAIHDFCEFLEWGFAKRHALWCRAVKKGSSGRWVTGAYHRASGLRGFPHFPLLSLHRLIDDPNVDLIISVPQYLRTIYDPVHQSGYDGSLLLHKKLQITELDLRTGEIVYYSRWGSPFWSAHNPPAQYATDVQRYVASAIEKGGTFHAYDMNGGWFNTPNALAAWGKGCNLLKERVPLPWNNRHVGVFSSENFWHYQSQGKNRLTVYAAVENPSYALYRAGVPNKHYLLRELFHPAKEFRAPQVMIFLNAGSMTAAQAETIRREYGRDHRVIVWHWAPGMFTADGEKSIGKITGFQLRRMPKEDNLTLVAEENSTDPLLKNVHGYLMPTSRIHSDNCGVSYEVVDKNAKILARYQSNRLPGMAVKRYKDHTEVYVGSPCGLTPQLCRNLAVEAGLSPFLETDDFCGYNAGILYVSALTAGKKVITLPKGLTVEKCMTGQTLRMAGGKAELEMKTGELLLLKLKKTN